MQMEKETGTRKANGKGLAAPHRKKQIEHRKQTMPRRFHTAGTFFPKTPGIFYVFLSGNVCFRRGKRTFPGRETYVSHTGNIENHKAIVNHFTDIFRIPENLLT